MSSIYSFLKISSKIEKTKVVFNKKCDDLQKNEIVIKIRIPQLHKTDKIPVFYSCHKQKKQIRSAFLSLNLNVSTEKISVYYSFLL